MGPLPDPVELFLFLMYSGAPLLGQGNHILSGVYNYKMFDGLRREGDSSLS